MQKQNRKTLIFLSERYPYNFYEKFYEEKEINELHSEFEKVLVINNFDDFSAELSNKIPINVKYICCPSKRDIFNKIVSFRYFFSIRFIHELLFVKKQLKLQFEIKLLKIIIAELDKANRLKKCIKKCIISEKIKLDELLIYAFWNDYRSLAISLLKQENPQIIAISRSHGGDVYFERHPFNYLPFKKFIFNTLDAIFTISDASKNYLINKINHTKGNVYTIKLGITNLFPLKEYNPNKILSIISCSHIVKIKRVDLIAEALNIIENFPYIWHHIGEDYLNNEVKNYVKANFVTKHKKSNFLGTISNNELMVYYNKTQIDVFINTSSSEGIPVSIMEAMSFGIPAIATNVGGTSEIVKDGVNGFLLSENPTPEEIASTIEKFYNLSFQEKIQMRKNAYETWKEEYNADKNYKMFIEKILSL